MESTNGDGEGEGSHKSPNGGEKSPGQSSSTSSANADDEGGSPCSSQMHPTLSSVLPQFRREAKGSEATCARTDLVYIHSAEEKLANIQSATPIPFPLDSYQLARLQEKPATAATAAAVGAVGLIPLIQANIPISIEQQQQQQLILAQQQQVLAQVAALNNTNPHELTEFLRQAEAIAMQIQKEPALLHVQDPNVQVMLKRREVLMQQIQSVGMQLEQFQRMQQEAILQHHHHQQHQAELLQKQQQQQFILTRPPLPEEVHTRNRPGESSSKS